MQKLCKVYYPAEFNSERVYRHPKFDEDMKEILEKSGLGKKFAEAFRQKLYFIEKDMHRSTEAKWFEKLKEEDGLYSIKFKGTKNVRIICMFTDSSKRKIVILLCGFEEKNNKNNSKDSYDKGVEKAIKRKKEVEHGFVLEGEE
jgi:hypothetical protein